MKIELHIETLRETAVFMAFLPELTAARAADRAESDANWRNRPFASRATGATTEATTEAECETAAVKPQRGETAAVRDRRTGRRYLLPAFGSARRTKAELAEDAELTELAALLGKSKSDTTSDPVVYLLPAWREESTDAGTADAAAAQISTSPEDRQDPAQVTEDAIDGEVMDDVVEAEVTADMLKAAMSKVAETRGMPWLIENMTSLTGAAKFSLIDAASYAAAFAALTEAAAEVDVNG